MVFDKFKPKMGAVGNKATDVEVAQAEAPHLKRVEWMSDPGLRKLYLSNYWLRRVCEPTTTTI
jgi:hypothetical protein